MKLIAKTFDELSAKEIYEILKARAEIFIMEQEILYQDCDDKDYNALHLFYEQDGKVIAYMRVYDKAHKVKQLGRILTLEHGKGIGRKFLEDSISEIVSRFDPDKIFIEAQSYAVGFYEKFGFKVCSDEFLEEGILHKEMELLIK